MFGLFKKEVSNEKYITDINLELSKLNREVQTLTAKYDKIEELYLSIKGRTNKKKKEEEEQTDDSPLGKVLVPT